jgi:hypothetical protein
MFTKMSFPINNTIHLGIAQGCSFSQAAKQKKRVTLDLAFPVLLVRFGRWENRLNKSGNKVLKR